MPTEKRHLYLSGYVKDERYRSKNTARGDKPPKQDRKVHGQKLLNQYQLILDNYEQTVAPFASPITTEKGIYVELISQTHCKLPLDSLDNQDFKLCSCKQIKDTEVAVVFIPEQRRRTFIKKATEYLTKDNKPDKAGEIYPRHHKLIASIAQIKLPDLRSFWTDEPSLFPLDEKTPVWWELWLKKTSEDSAATVASKLAARLNGQLGNFSLNFFDTYVVLIRASAINLAKAPELISNLEELRFAKQTPNPIIDSTPIEQMDWANNIAQRLHYSEKILTSIAILDTGVNYNHPLLKYVCRQDLASAWEPNWPMYDQSHWTFNGNQHGSLQAGIAAFGDLMNIALNNAPIVISHVIESARILPPTGSNEPQLFGAITTGTAAKLEIDRPNLNRVYSLAVTASEHDSGQPSSWSAAIDNFSYNEHGQPPRLFVISTGNNRELHTLTDYWDQVALTPIEDPAQAWNAVTVGAYTEMTVNDDPDFAGWSPFAIFGDIAPSSRSSVSWRWRKQAPYKPDIVAEGGNKLMSPSSDEISNADTVSILTTSGKTTGQIFECTGDSSAACATVSRYAALLMAQYTESWPETIRGLLIHSSQWTARMQERYDTMQINHTPKVAKENILRMVGYGVPNMTRALHSANHALTLVAQGLLKPFTKAANAKASDDPVLHQMMLYQLPWPIEELQMLPPQLEIKLRVTLSYFIEPNPGRRGNRTRYTYQSHGLRFEVIRPGQSLENFRASINKLADTGDYDGKEGVGDGWFLGPQLRTRGSVHSDVWTGSAQDLADMHTIAVFPVSGWWKYKTAMKRWKNTVRYSLIVSIDVPDESIDIYSVVENQIKINIET